MSDDKRCVQIGGGHYGCSCSDGPATTTALRAERDRLEGELAEAREQATAWEHLLNVEREDRNALRDRIRQVEAERDEAWNDAIEEARCSASHFIGAVNDPCDHGAEIAERIAALARPRSAPLPPQPARACSDAACDVTLPHLAHDVASPPQPATLVHGMPGWPVAAPLSPSGMCSCDGAAEVCSMRLLIPCPCNCHASAASPPQPGEGSAVDRAVELLRLAAPYVKERVQRELDGGVNITDVLGGTFEEYDEIMKFLDGRPIKPA
jgi:hypothetical protein